MHHICNFGRAPETERWWRKPLSRGMTGYFGRKGFSIHLLAAVPLVAAGENWTNT
jgi:hypothetical protein